MSTANAGEAARAIVGADLHEKGDTALVPFTNANPHVDTFRMKFRPLVIGSRSYTIQQSMDDRPVELSPLHPGMKWTGAAVWDPAIVLCQYLEKNTHLFAGKRVLEVGAGHALVSVLTASLGAAHVVATDYSEEVLSLARANFQLNLKNDDEPSGVVEARALEWGSKGDMAALNPPFDLVVASDCVYKQDLFTPLLETLEAAVGDEGLILLSHKPRGLREEKFFHKLKQRMVVLKVLGPEDLDASFLKSNVFLHLCRRKRAAEL
jgi:predicted nicotinamide N-methyase